MGPRGARVCAEEGGSVRLFRNPAQPLPRRGRRPHAAQPSALEAGAWLTHGPYISGLGGRWPGMPLDVGTSLFFFFALRNVRPVWGGMWCLVYNKLPGAVHTPYAVASLVRHSGVPRPGSSASGPPEPEGRVPARARGGRDALPTPAPRVGGGCPSPRGLPTGSGCPRALVGLSVTSAMMVR